MPIATGGGGGGGVDGLGSDVANSSSQLREYGLGMVSLSPGVEEKDVEEEEEVVEDQDGGDEDAVDISEVGGLEWVGAKYYPSFLQSPLMLPHFVLPTGQHC